MAHRNHRRGRSKETLVTLEGRNVVLEALRAKKEVNKILIDEGATSKGKIDEILYLAKEGGVPVITKTRKELDGVSVTLSHQGVIAFTSKGEEITLKGLLKRLGGKSPFLVVLGEVMYEQNLGAILRTSECAGVDGIIIPKRRSAPMSATVSRVSMGASEYVPVIREGVASALSVIRRESIMVFGVDASGDMPYFEADLTGASAFVFGGEDKGLSEMVRKKCDVVISIPLLGRISSLNVSVSAGIVLYEKVRQQLRSK